MPRIARIVAVGYPHHVTQRGNYQQKTFRCQKDFVQYLIWLEKYCQQYFLFLYAYCLMPNHVHFIVAPQKENSMAKVFNFTHMMYSQYFNKKHHLRGHLWQGRFYSCVLSESHLYAAIKYVEKNPKRAGLVKNSWEWKWSSALAHIENRDINGIKLADLSDLMPINNWKEYLEEDDKEDEVEKIRKHTLTGRSLGSEGFAKEVNRICQSNPLER
jgi:putative transposase